MNPVLHYILEMLVCSGVFLAVYAILPKRTGGFVGLRAYVLVCTVLSAVLPLIEFPVYFPEGTLPGLPVAGGKEVPADLYGFALPGESVLPIDSTVDAPVQNVGPGTGRKFQEPYLGYALAGTVYILAVSVLAFATARRLWGIWKLRKSAAVADERRGGLKYSIAQCKAVESPFSFMKTIYIGCKLDGMEKDMVIAHELSHIRHGHPLEKLLMSAMCIILWFNPFIWMFRRKLEEVQEFEADRDVLSEGYDMRLYRLTIFKQLFGYYPEISCGLKNSLTKRRFIMMTVKKSTRFAAFRWMAAIVFVSGTAFFSGATAASRENDAHAAGFSADQVADVEAMRQDGADTLVIEISDKGKSIVLNGNAEAGPEALLGNLSSLKADIAVISAADDTPMGTIVDLKNVLRQCGIVKLIYGSAEKDGEVGKDAPERLLPPPSSGDVKILDPGEMVEEMNAQKDPVVSVKINGNGMILVVSGGDVMKTGDSRTEFAAALAELIKVNPDAYVAVQADRGTSYQAFKHVLEQVDQVYAIVRNDYSMEKFGKPFDRLEEDEADEVKARIPMRVIECEPHDSGEAAR